MPSAKLLGSIADVSRAACVLAGHRASVIAALVLCASRRRGEQKIARKEKARKSQGGVGEPIFGEGSHEGQNYKTGRGDFLCGRQEEGGRGGMS